MARYETGTDDTRRFWEIRVFGNTLQTRDGRVGSDGRLRDPKAFGSEAEARKEADKRIAGKLKNGFELVDDPVDGQAENPALAEAIRDNPDDVGAYLVYSDWLQAQGDKRGQLATVQQQLAANPQDAALQKTEAKLKKVLAPGRVLKMANKKRSAKKAESGYSRLEWRCGFIDRARIARNSDRPPYTVRELTASLLQHPSAQVLRSLTIGSLAVSGLNNYAPVIAEIVAAAPASLRDLYIAEFDSNEVELSNTYLGDISALYPVLPRLHNLHLRAGSLELGAIALPTLRSLTIATGLFQERALLDIADASWPELGHLHLESNGLALPLAGMTALRASRSLASLRHLALVNTSDVGDLWRGVLRDSPLLPRLQVLDLSRGDLSDQDAEELLGQRHRLEHLRVLDLCGQYFSDDAVAALGDVCAEVRLADQRPSASGTVLTDQQIVDFAPDSKSLLAARKIAKPGKWSALGSLRNRWLGGRCHGSSDYQVYVDTGDDVMDMESGCTCPSQKYPCKHAIALLMMAQSHPIPADLPSSWIDEVDETASYDNIWE